MEVELEHDLRLPRTEQRRLLNTVRQSTVLEHVHRRHLPVTYRHILSVSLLIPYDTTSLHHVISLILPSHTPLTPLIPIPFHSIPPHTITHHTIPAMPKFIRLLTTTQPALTRFLSTAQPALTRSLSVTESSTISPCLSVVTSSDLSH